MVHIAKDPVAHIKNNPLQTKRDLQTLMQDMATPLTTYFSPDKAYLDLGHTQAHYSPQVIGYEAFSRLLWGLAPLIAGGGSVDVWEDFITGLKNGTNPNHPEFWGYPRDYDQKTVETAAIGLTIALCSPDLLASFSTEEKENLHQWIRVVNEKKTPDNNWNLFKVLVNLGLAKAGMEDNQAANERAFERIETYYLGDGWYADGQTEQKDYYVSFAIHFYCLIYAKMKEKDDPERSALFKERASQFAKDFIYWFGADGSSIPFGRSLTYRFAQTAFWSALAFAEVEAFPWGVIKGIVLRHLRWWMQQPIFTSDGILTIGYAYPNLIMSENYNAPGSPYWALKSFLVLALADDHPFWQAKEQPLPDLEQTKVLTHANMIMRRDAAGEHVYALTSGQYAGFEPAHTAEKYAKFAYSNQFGFSVAKETYGLRHGSFDSTLALSERDNHYRVRRQCEQVQITEHAIYSLWRPWKDVQIETWLIPVNGWDIRIHHIETDRELHGAEGGFSVPVADPYAGNMKPDQSFTKTKFGASGMIDLCQNRSLKRVRSSPNTNLLYANVCEIPTLVGDIPKGKHWLAAAVYAATNQQAFEEIWATKPSLQIRSQAFHITCGGKEFQIQK
ncbi:DUF2264 domain-containing protein [Ornithinibacillus gellani]|uniref:DUF2264 domain-containing protein n=1 Tax=Ornithinibacillus gellani TaxID=2293253 RepID=UPI0016816352|nr:DUF2264 domain-containing protein [Ornithinibacillus gellani]